MHVVTMHEWKTRKMGLKSCITRYLFLLLYLDRKKYKRRKVVWLRETNRTHFVCMTNYGCKCCTKCHLHEVFQQLAREFLSSAKARDSLFRKICTQGNNTLYSYRFRFKFVSFLHQDSCEKTPLNRLSVAASELCPLSQITKINHLCFISTIIALLIGLQVVH